MTWRAEAPEWSETADKTFRLSYRVIQVAMPIVPTRRRADWESEWVGELWYRIATLDRTGSLDRGSRLAILSRSLGAVPHAFWLRRTEWTGDMALDDLKFATRVHWRRPGFSLLVIAILALGIGATSSMFSIVNAVLVRPLPYEGASRLVYAYGAFQSADHAAISPMDFIDYRMRNQVFESLAARSVYSTAVISGGTDPERVDGPSVSANFFSVLGVAPLVGRTFLPSDEDGQHRVVILSYSLWQRRFGNDPRVVGTTTTIDGEPTTIVGVMPAILAKTFSDQLWLPFPFHAAWNKVRRFHKLRAIGRLRNGVPLERAQAQMNLIAKQLAAAYPEDGGWGLRLVPYHEVVVGGASRVLVLLFAAVAFVLVIACGNVASLLLARASTRDPEIAVRTALGASQIRIVRQLLTESLVLGVAGGAAGLVLTAFMVRGVRGFASGILPRATEVRLDGQAILFAIGITLATAVSFGLAPAVRAVRQDVAASIRALGQSAHRRRILRGRDALVVGQVSLSLVLLIGAGLLLRSMWLLQRVDIGFDPSRLLTAQVELPVDQYRSRADVERFWTTFLERVHGLPGIQGAAGTSLLPLTGHGDAPYYVEGRRPRTEAEQPVAEVSVVTDDFFSATGIPVLAGRALNATDRSPVESRPTGQLPDSAAADPGASPVGAVVISRQMASRLFPHERAVGKRLVASLRTPFVAEIVGVAGDVHAFGQDVAAPDIMYFAQGQSAASFAGNNMSLVVRTRGDPTSLVPGIREILREIEPNVPLASVAMMGDLVRDSIADSYVRTRLLASFALIALLLAVIGLYSVLAYTVTQRTREIGLRMALGARRVDILRSVIERGMLLVGLGVLLGLIVAFSVTRLFAGMLFQVGTTDPLVFIGVTVCLLFAGLAACWVPARRAMAISPALALKGR